MIKQGTLAEVTKIKEGVGKFGKSWTLYRVRLEDGFVATTFDDIYSDRIGMEVTLEVEKVTNEGKNGVKYENYNIVPAKPQKRVAPQDNKKFEELMTAINDLTAVVAGIDAKLDEVLDAKEAIRVKKEIPF